jgi:hypothetical protein
VPCCHQQGDILGSLTDLAYCSASSRTSFVCSFARLQCVSPTHRTLLDTPDRLLTVVVKDDLSEQTGRRIVHVDDDMFEASDCFERPLDQVGSSWCQDLSSAVISCLVAHLNPYVIRNFLSIVELPAEVEIKLRRSWVGYFYLLEPDLHKMSEETKLLLVAHG